MRAFVDHLVSTRIICENQAVYVEDLCVKGLGRTRLAKSVHDAGWSAFVRMLAYKAARYGRFFAKVDRFLAFSQTCSQCWAIDCVRLAGPGETGTSARREVRAPAYP